MASPYHGAAKGTSGHGKKFIAGAIRHPGIEQAAAAKAGVSTQQYLQEHKNDPGVAGKRARFGLVLTKISRGK